MTVLLSINTGSGLSPTYVKANLQDIVLLCGRPGAGKSTFYWKRLKPLGYERVNQDILKTVGSTTFYSSYETNVIGSEIDASKLQENSWVRASLLRLVGITNSQNR
jgi:hypothetical protein